MSRADSKIEMTTTNRDWGSAALSGCLPQDLLKKFVPLGRCFGFTQEKEPSLLLG